MGKLHYFYPANDLALASGKANYTPPQAAARLQRAGELLPLWYGDPGDKVLCYGINKQWLQRLERDFGIAVGPYNHSDLLQPDPWGWSLAVRSAYLQEGIPADMLPTDEKLARLRELSHRRTCAAVASQLAGRCPEIAFAAPPAVEIDDPGRVGELLSGEGDWVLKSPWSSTGRGVVNTRDSGKDKALMFAANAIRQQGSVMAERALDKAIDFAKIYQCDGGECRELGTSVFATDAHGAYTGNLLAPEADRLAAVGEYLDLQLLSVVAERLREVIESAIAPHYDGILGVDMLATKQGLLQPYVEINLRKTMGYVANVFADRHLAQGSRGIFSVLPVRGEQKKESYAAEGSRIASGVLYLTPQNPNFAFAVECHGE